MKKIVLLLALLVATLTVSAENILYFTYNQASRTVPFLNNQNELMIYCGYEDELPTYVLVNEVWAEQISSSFYEIWLYGFDAYTGEEVYMPIDLGCIWLMNRGNIYSAAQALRIRSSHGRPHFAWAMPPYNPFTRRVRPVTFYYTYHYDIHRPGWRYDLYPSMHYHPYYLRRPAMPAPMPPVPYTPGKEYPGYHVNNNGTYTYTSQPLMGNITACRSQVTVQNNPSSRSGNTITSNRSNNTITTTDRSTGRSSTVSAPARTSENSSRSSSSVSRDNGSTSRSSATRSSNSTSRNSSVSSDNNSRSSSSTSRSSATRSDNNSRSSSVSSDNNSRSTTSSSRSSATRSDNSSDTKAKRSSSRSTKVEGDNSSSSSRSTSSSRVSNSDNDDNSGSTSRSSSSSSRNSSSSSRNSSSRSTSSR